MKGLWTYWAGTMEEQERRPTIQGFVIDLFCSSVTRVFMTKNGLACVLLCLSVVILLADRYGCSKQLHEKEQEAERLSVLVWNRLDSMHDDIERVAENGVDTDDSELIHTVFNAVLAELYIRSAKRKSE